MATLADRVFPHRQPVELVLEHYTPRPRTSADWALAGEQRQDVERYRVRVERSDERFNTRMVIFRVICAECELQGTVFEIGDEDLFHLRSVEELADLMRMHLKKFIDEHAGHCTGKPRTAVRFARDPIPKKTKKPIRVIHIMKRERENEKGGKV